MQPFETDPLLEGQQRRQGRQTHGVRLHLLTITLLALILVLLLVVSLVEHPYIKAIYIATTRPL